ncbi:MAG: T9SS type A sorting domain-containing protein [Bacteroidales bacterium]
MISLRLIGFGLMTFLIPTNFYAQLGPGGVGYEDTSEPGQPQLVLWLKADATGLKDGDAVTTWEDWSGNDHHAISGAATHPVFQATGLNNQPCIYFDGASWFKVPEKTNLDGGPGISIFLITQPQAVDQGGGMKLITKRNHWNLWGGGLSKETCKYSFNLDFHGRDENQYIMAHVNGNVPENKVETEAIYGDTSRAILVDYVYSGDYAAIRVNGINNSGTKPNPNFSVAGTGDVEDYDNEVTIAAAKYVPQLEGEIPIGDFLTGKIAEIAVYRCALDSTQLQIIENYFAAKYKLSIGEDKLFKDTICSYNLIALGSKDGTKIHHEAGNGIINLVERDESINAAGEYLFCADDNAALEMIEEDIPDNWQTRWSRTWKIEKYGEIDAELWINYAEAGFPLTRTREYGLLYKSHMDDEFTTLIEGGDAKFGNLIFVLPDENLQTGYYTVAERKSTVSVKPFLTYEFEVYPNPTTGTITLKSDIPGINVNISLIGISGQVIRDLGTQTFTGNTLILNELNDLQKGMYILKIKNSLVSKNISLIKQ